MSDSGPSIDRPRTGLRVTVGVLVVFGIAAVVHRAILVVPSLSAGVPSVDSGRGARPHSTTCPPATPS